MKFYLIMKKFYIYIFTLYILFTNFSVNAQNRGCTSPSAPKILNNQIVLCELDSLMLSDIEVIGENIKWYATETSTSNLKPSEFVVPGRYYASQSVLTDGNILCESETRLEIEVIASTIKTPDIKLEENVFCAKDKKQLKDLIFEYPKELLSGSKLLFYDKSGKVISETTVIQQQQNYSVSYFDGTCLSNKLSFSISLDEGDVLDGFISIQKCGIEGATLLDVPLNYSKVNWYANQYDTITIAATQLLKTANYYFSTTNNRGCESVSRTKVSVQVDNGLAPSNLVQSQQICESKSLVFSSLSINSYPSGTIFWYETSNATKPYAMNDPIKTNKTYWASYRPLISNGCESVERIPILVQVVNSIDVQFEISPMVYCSGATIPPLPLVSKNGIKGKWSPAINNQQTTTYTFTPTTGQCGVNNQLTITINATPSSDFTLPSVVPIQTKLLQLIPVIKAGKFTGKSVTGDFFYPPSAGFGYHKITYSKTSTEGCKSSTTKTTLVCDTIGGTYSDTVIVKKYIYDTIEIKTYVTVYDTVKVQKITYDTIRTYLTIYDTISVSDTLKIKLSITTGNSEITENLIRVFPNPSNGLLFIDNGNFQIMKNYFIQISDLQGKEIFNEEVRSQRNEIDLKNFVKGIYLLNIRDGNGNLSVSKKIVLE